MMDLDVFDIGGRAFGVIGPLCSGICHGLPHAFAAKVDLSRSGGHVEVKRCLLPREQCRIEDL
jgi:hypothetical protein